jgi:cell division initiation protein
MGLPSPFTPLWISPDDRLSGRRAIESEVVSVKMTSLDIRKQTFKKVMRGYDKDEVQAFLEMIADEFERLNRDNLKLQENDAQLRAEVDRFRSMEETLQEMLKTAQQAAEDVRENARKEGRLMVKEAELLANRAIEKARSQVHTIRAEVVELRNQRDLFLARFQALTQAQTDFLAQLEFTDTNVVQESVEDDEPDSHGNGRATEEAETAT